MMRGNKDLASVAIQQPHDLFASALSLRPSFITPLPFAKKSQLCYSCGRCRAAIEPLAIVPYLSACGPGHRQSHGKEVEHEGI